jgi:hypothetical protein
METITRKPYETDPTDDEWAILEPILQRALYGDKTKTRGHPRHYYATTCSYLGYKRRNFSRASHTPKRQSTPQPAASRAHAHASTATTHTTHLRQALTQTLTRQHRKLYRRHIQPTRAAKAYTQTLTDAPTDAPPPQETHGTTPQAYGSSSYPIPPAQHPHQDTPRPPTTASATQSPQPSDAPSRAPNADAATAQKPYTDYTPRAVHKHSPPDAPAQARQATAR